jgi:hypothetical protein
MDTDLLDDFQDTEFSYDELTEDTDIQDEYISDEDIDYSNTDEDEEEDGEESEEEDDDTEQEEDEDDEDSDESDEDEESEDEDLTYIPFVENLVDEGIIDWDGETEYDDSPEGFSQMINDTVERRISNAIDNLPEDVRRLIDIGLQGGDVREAFTKFEEVDYSKADIEDEDVAKELIKEFYTSTNPKWNEARINKQIEMLEDAGELEDEAKLAQEYMVEKTEESRQAYLDSIRQQREAEEEAYYDELNAYTEIIDKNDSLFGLPFASRQEKEAFKSYVFERGEDGKTQAERDDEDRVVRLTKEFYKFRNFNYEDVERKVTTKKSIELKKALSRFADKNSKSNRSDTTRSTNTKGKFSLGSLPDDF